MNTHKKTGGRGEVTFVPCALPYYRDYCVSLRLSYHHCPSVSWFPALGRDMSRGTPNLRS